MAFEAKCWVILLMVFVFVYLFIYFFLREQEGEKSFIINPKLIRMDLSALSALCSLQTPVVTGNPATLALLSPSAPSCVPPPSPS